MENINLYEYFQNKALRTNSLFQVEIDVTASCNADCPFCFQGAHSNDKENEMSFDEIVNLLDTLRKMGTCYVAFSGGEPFCRKDFIKILSEAKKRGFRISIITNAMLLNKCLIDELHDLCLDRITISLHSVNKENYMFHFGLKNEDLYYKALENIDYIIEKKLPLGFAVTVTKNNIDELMQIENYIKAKGLSEYSINYNMLLTGKRQINPLMPTNEQILKNHNFFAYKDKFSMESVGKGKTCIAGKSSCTINCYGEVFPCTFFRDSVGNIRTKNLEEIWRNSEFLKTLRSINDDHFFKCQDCSAKDKCTICMAANLNETGNIFKSSDLYCKSRKAKVNIYD